MSVAIEIMLQLKAGPPGRFLMLKVFIRFWRSRAVVVWQIPEHARPRQANPIVKPYCNTLEYTHIPKPKHVCLWG